MGCRPHCLSSISLLISRYLYLSLYLYLFLSFSLYIAISIYLYFSLSLYIYIFLSIHISLSTYVVIPFLPVLVDFERWNRRCKNDFYWRWIKVEYPPKVLAYLNIFQTLGVGSSVTSSAEKLSHRQKIVQNSISHPWCILRSIIAEYPIFVKIRLVWPDISTGTFRTCEFRIVSQTYLI